MNHQKIQDRAFDFAVEIVELNKSLKRKEPSLSNQLLRSATSVGANTEEAENAQSRADFIHKMSIAQKEAAETYYWIKLLHKTNYLNDELAQRLKKESKSILQIIKSIIVSTKRNNS